MNKVALRKLWLKASLLLEKILWLLGYMTAKEALKNDFTHHGSYYGIPCWIVPNHDFTVATKWAPMEWVMTAFHVIEGFLRSCYFPDDEPGFQFLLGPEIRKTQNCPVCSGTGIHPDGFECHCCEGTGKWI